MQLLPKGLFGVKLLLGERGPQPAFVVRPSRGSSSACEFQMTPQDLLRLHPFFSALPPADIDKLLVRTRRRRVLAGKVLFAKNAPGDGLYGVLSGRIAFTVDSADGK